jgi:hypothetical protein
MVALAILAPAIVAFLALQVAAFFTLFPKHQNGFVQPKHAPGVKVADHARHDLPKIRMGERTSDLTSGVNFVSRFRGTLAGLNFETVRPSPLALESPTARRSRC